ncbi:hypothetical protein OS493_040477, partial [Desmophyllum pertusum]
QVLPVAFQETVSNQIPPPPPDKRSIEYLLWSDPDGLVWNAFSALMEVTTRSCHMTEMTSSLTA